MNRCILVTVFGACLLGGCAEDSPEQLLMKGMQKAAQGDEEAENRVVFVPAASDATGPTVEHIRFCASRPRGYRDYVPQPGATYRTGETAWIYFDIGNLESRRRFDGDIENALRQSLQLRDPSGTLLVDTVVVDEVLTIKSHMDGDRVFLRNHIDILADAPTGEYRVDLVVEDRIAGAMTQVDSSFTVTP